MKLSITTAPLRNSRHWKPGSITWDEIVAWCDAPASKKESGNYVLGSLRTSTVRHDREDHDCTDYHRKKTTIISRSALTLDVDYPEPDFADKVELLLPSMALMHTTFSSTPEKPRYRLIIPLDREVAPDEYYVAAQAVMQQFGEEQFDTSTAQAERYMFKPASKKLEDFWFIVIPGKPAKADELLANFDPDLSTLPMPKKHKNKRDPFAIEGTIGAFNRVYQDFGFLIKEYDLPYEPMGDNRWHLVGAAGAAGMGPVQGTEGLVYSHHTSDPAYGITCSAFDLARLHLYGDLDEDVPEATPINRRPSNKAMLEKATEDVNVVRELLGGDFEDDLDATADAIQQDNWWLGFRLDSRTGQPTDDIHNWDLIARNDSAFKGLFFNELTMAIETEADSFPWRTVTDRTRAFTKGDQASLALYIERQYHIRPPRSYLDDIINDIALPRRINPIAKYLDSLKWDGKPRVETCLPGVKPTPYTRLVARKAFAAAAARMLDPGIKWDHMVVLYGLEGLGKTHWVEILARGHSSDLGRIGDKDTLIKMQRSWIILSDENTSMKKADFDAQKEFITRTHDVFRMPYDREAQSHPRHCVIWGTTNEDAFLRRQEGNRRFLIVRCEEAVDFEILTDEYVDQVWAEAVAIYRSGERLWLTDDENTMAKLEREEFTEENATAGIVESYLETLVPDNWETMTPEARQSWLQASADGFTPVGTHKIMQTCSLQIWVEAMGRRRGDHNRTDLIEISSALKNLPGWKPLPGSHRIGGYGPQKVFQRIEEDEEDLI